MVRIAGTKFYKVGIMTEQQEIHLQLVKEQFNELVDFKYRKGQAEHGGNLCDMSPLQLLNNAIDEAIDQITYLLTLRDKLVIR